MGKLQELVLSFSQQPCGLGSRTAPRIIKALSQFGRLVVKGFSVNGPAQQSTERLAVKTSNLLETIKRVWCFLNMNNGQMSIIDIFQFLFTETVE